MVPKQLTVYALTADLDPKFLRVIVMEIDPLQKEQDNSGTPEY